MSVSRYTHNLNIFLVKNDNNDNINDIELIESIYAELADKHIKKKGHIFNSKFEIHLLWERLSITEAESKFMGVLFTNSLHSDRILYEATKTLLSDIENKLKNQTTDKNWKIIFHISKLQNKY